MISHHPDLVILDNQLETFIHDVRFNNEFIQLNEILGFGEKMMEMKRDVVYTFVYKIVKFVLISLVTTASVGDIYS